MNLNQIKGINKIVDDGKVIKISEGKMINVKKYLPSEQKMFFVMDVLNRSFTFVL